MDTPEIRPEPPAPVDPIGPQFLPKMSRQSLRALALTGVAIGTPLIAIIATTSTGTPTTKC